MNRQMTIGLTSILLVIAVAVAGGCKEKMVGAPCKPEAGGEAYNKEIQDQNWSIETRSVQCETRLCLTSTQFLQGTQKKYSFCSCRCEDKDGNTKSDDPDKYDDLCECPPSAVCENVLGEIKGVPKQVLGSYCMPKCVAQPCDQGKECSPSTDSEHPWKWKCKEPTTDTSADTSTGTSAGTTTTS